jgi:UDPglucose 6-dehydrogenase
MGTLRGKTIGILGLAFKPNTDDMREAPSIEIIHLLQSEGAHVKAYDPAAMEKAKRIIQNITFCNSPYEVAEDSDALIIVTEWNEFRQLDMERIKGSMRQPILFDGRNIYNPQRMKSLGFIYRGVGRGY